MSQIPERDTVEKLLGKLFRRVEALEAKQVTASGGFGESVEVDNAPGGQPFSVSTEVLEFDVVYDPHSIFDGTDTFTIPVGMGGIWQLEHVWEIGAE